MSNYNQAADIAEHQLKFISKSMCYAKWAQVSMHLTNGMTQSCYHPPLHKIDTALLKENPSALHNTDQKKQERKMMLKGDRPAGCEYCWKIEDVGGRSDRIYRSGEYWAQNARLDIFEAIDTGNVDPRYVEVNFNQACNFKCMYCSPHLSTAWEDEVEKFGPYEVLNSSGQLTEHNNINALKSSGFMPLKVRQDENPYVEAFWRWWPQLYKKLEVLRMTGGEPLMDVNTFKVLDYIYQHPNQWLEVSVTTNMCPPKPELFNKFIDSLKKLEEIQIWEDKERFNPGSGNHWYVNMAVKNFAVFVSLDSVSDQAEYIRSGLDYTTLQKNVTHLLDDTCNTTLTFINTFNALSVPKFKDFLKYILELRTKYNRQAQGIKYIPIHDPYHTHPDHQVHPRQRVWFDVPLLRNPAWQNIHILPEEFEQYLDDAIKFMEDNFEMGNFDGFYDFEIEKVKRNLKIMKERNPNQTINRKNFVNYFQEYDRRKNTNLVKTFPELENVYNDWRKI
jgi:organic radical activating enzyme